MKKQSIAALSLIVSLLLAGCGGGGGSGGSSDNGTTFNIDEAFKTLHAQGQSTSLRGTGECSGSWVHVLKPAQAGSHFAGNPSLAAPVTTTTFVSTECALPSTISAYVAHYDTDLLPLGYSSHDTYAVHAAPPTLPVAAKIGDRGNIGVIELFGDESQRQSLGREEVSYTVDADANRTGGAIVSIVTRRYDAANLLQSNTQHRYSIAASTPLTLVAAAFDGIEFTR